MVIGPTPPGTGVIAPATCTASSKATSPTSRDLPPSAGTRLMPTSITAAPGLIQSPRTICGRPVAAIRISAPRAIAGRSRDLECATVTVQSAASSSCAIGRPTIADRPITSAFSPARLPSVSSSSIMQPTDVHGAIAAWPLASRPAFIG